MSEPVSATAITATVLWSVLSATVSAFFFTVGVTPAHVFCALLGALVGLTLKKQLGMWVQVALIPIVSILSALFAVGAVEYWTLKPGLAFAASAVIGIFFHLGVTFFYTHGESIATARWGGAKQ